MASDKDEFKQNNLYYIRKDMGPLNKEVRLQLDKKTIWLKFSKTINFKVRKIIRWQLKTSNMILITCASIGGH